MATSTHRWGTPGTYTDPFAAQALKNMANAAVVVSNEIDNSGASSYMHMHLDFLFRVASAPGAGKALEVYLIPTVDGTNYADSTAPIPATQFLCAFPSRGVNTAQRVSVLHLTIPRLKFKLAVVNSLGQALTNTNDENVLSYRMVNAVTE